MIKAVQLKPSVVARPREALKRGPIFKVRCAVSVPRETPPTKKTPLRAALLEAPTKACFVNKTQAHEFNQCYINFENLNEEDAYQCVRVAEDILAGDCQTNICDDDVCTEREHVDWFKGYMSNAYGL